MNDRVADRAAAHATRAELAVRDWLLVGLSFATAMYEATCFLTFGKVFTAAQTGNLVLPGIGVLLPRAGAPFLVGSNAKAADILKICTSFGTLLVWLILQSSTCTRCRR